MRQGLVLVAAALAGCGFQSGSAQTDGGPGRADAGVDGSIDAVERVDPCADPDLRLCLTFDHLAGTDGSASHNDAILSNVGGITRPAPDGFDEPAVAVTVVPVSEIKVTETPTLDLAPPFTIELWVNPDMVALTTGRLGILDNNGEYGIFINPTGTTCSFTTTSVTKPGLVAGQWNHLACVFSPVQGGNPGKVELFVGGTSLASVNMNNDTPGVADDGLRIGQNGNDGFGDQNLAGKLDNVRIWARALTPSELQQAAAGEL